MLNWSYTLLKMTKPFDMKNLNLMKKLKLLFESKTNANNLGVKKVQVPSTGNKL